MVFSSADYPGEKGEHLLKKCFKICDAPLIKKLISFVVIPSWKYGFFTNMTDKLNKLIKSNVVYQLSNPDCGSSYIGNTERTHFERTKEHITCADSAIKLSW